MCPKGVICEHVSKECEIEVPSHAKNVQEYTLAVQKQNRAEIDESFSLGQILDHLESTQA